MITNLWAVPTRFRCDCHPGQKVYMEAIKGPSSTFYACPRYMVRDELHPGGREKGEPQCPNRISFDDAQSIIDKYSAAIEDGLKAGGDVSTSNLRFTCRGIEVRLIKDDPGDFYREGERVFAVKNTKAVLKR